MGCSKGTGPIEVDKRKDNLKNSGDRLRLPSQFLDRLSIELTLRQTSSSTSFFRFIGGLLVVFRSGLVRFGRRTDRWSRRRRFRSCTRIRRLGTGDDRRKLSDRRAPNANRLVRFAPIHGTISDGCTSPSRPGMPPGFGPFGACGFATRVSRVRNRLTRVLGVPPEFRVRRSNSAFSQRRRSSSAESWSRS